MALSALVLCSRALLKIGAQPIASFDEGTAEAEVAAHLYPAVCDALLSAHPWSFATGQMELPRLLETPHADYAYAFQLPPDFLRVLSAGDGGRGRGLDFRLHENRLHANAPQVTLTYLFRPAESSFPAFFASALVARLAAEFCIPLTESSTRTDMLHRLADSEFRRARLADSQQQTARALEDFPLIAARG
ncbi:MAG TPA: hypothetical protein VNZ61_20405 [Roseomonas sp.]|nr:hypothetical protein [Roseomonas sp.]